MNKYQLRNLESLEPEYSQHVRAMTAELLNSKGDIAAELAHRDKVGAYRLEKIASLQAKARQFKAVAAGLSIDKDNKIKSLEAQLADKKGTVDKLAEMLREREGNMDGLVQKLRKKLFTATKELERVIGLDNKVMLERKDEILKLEAEVERLQEVVKTVIFEKYQIANNAQQQIASLTKKLEAADLHFKGIAEIVYMKKIRELEAQVKDFILEKTLLQGEVTAFTKVNETRRLQIETLKTAVSKMIDLGQDVLERVENEWPEEELDGDN